MDNMKELWEGSWRKGKGESREFRKECVWGGVVHIGSRASKNVLADISNVKHIERINAQIYRSIRCIRVVENQDMKKFHTLGHSTGW